MAPVADKYLTVHSVCVKCLHETNVQTAWPSESGNIYFYLFLVTDILMEDKKNGTFDPIHKILCNFV